MRLEMENLITELKKILIILRRHLDWDAANKRLQYLNQAVEDPSIWSDQIKAQELMKERQKLEFSVNFITESEQKLEDSINFIILGENEKDEELITEAEQEIIQLQKDLLQKQTEILLSGENDANDTYLEIHAGAGGTESQDWANMLLRMYSRWISKQNMKMQILEIHDGEEAGIKSVSILVKGHNAYGLLKTESGVHRLVRISPFDSNSRRHTSFASVWIYPVIDDNIEVNISESEVRIDTYRASGAGGQHVNTTDSAVRITHLATGIVVQCQAERSQYKNKETAWKMLKARLYEAEIKKREAEASLQETAKTEIGWGHQIRSYVLQPYQLVKDLRTGIESTNPTEVLDGELNAFIHAALAQRIQI
ncbi:peptide chain release factor 2 [Bartonella sp. DGB1]|uniref:peptide chain release factor 2 n=1 Tax=Bartonella sp. DGB1 TaxID=3239807 RepID=UPI003525F637